MAAVPRRSQFAPGGRTRSAAPHSAAAAERPFGTQVDVAGAAVAALLRFPEDERRAAEQVAAAVPCSVAFAQALIAQNGPALRPLGDQLIEMARQAGMSPAEAAGLVALRARRTAELSRRVAEFYPELGELVPEGTPIGAAVSPAEPERLARKHGFTVAPDGRPTLAADAGPD